MRVDWHPEAEDELWAAASALGVDSRGLSDALLDMVDTQIAQIRRFPYISARVRLPRLSADVRQCVLRRYNYLLIYRVRDQGIQIIALAHMRRRPGYWRGRLDG